MTCAAEGLCEVHAMMWIALSRRQHQPSLTLNRLFTSLFLFNLYFHLPLRLKEPLLYQKLPLCNRPSPTACSFLCVDQRPSFWLTDCAEMAVLSCGKRKLRVLPVWHEGNR